MLRNLNRIIHKEQPILLHTSRYMRLWRSEECSLFQPSSLLDISRQSWSNWVKSILHETTSTLIQKEIRIQSKHGPPYLKTTKSCSEGKMIKTFWPAVLIPMWRDDRSFPLTFHTFNRHIDQHKALLFFHGPIEQPNKCKKKNPLNHRVITPTEP